MANREELLLERLTSINKRIDWLASVEAIAMARTRAATDVDFWPEKLRLLDESDRILDELEKGWRQNA
jgi:ABC-type uncharacterized transport system ATPase subunit